MRPVPEPDVFGGYLLSRMKEALDTQGVDPSGLYGYYTHRVRVTKNGLGPHERQLAEFFWSHLPPHKERIIVHAGIGIGVLSSLLAAWGYVVVGVEMDKRRMAMAHVIRSHAIALCPDIETRYELVFGRFPDCVGERLDRKAILLFTNIAAGWNDQHVAQALALFPQCRAAILDLRTFGRQLPTKAERLGLRNRIVDLTNKWRPIGRQCRIYYHYFRF